MRVSAAILVASVILPIAAADPPPAERPAPKGCTERGELTDDGCSKGQPVYLPDGKAIPWLRTTTTPAPGWPEGTDEETTASLNLQLVVLPDGTVGEVQPTFLRVTVPGEEERRMNPTEDELGFVAAASEAVRRWRYAPPTLDEEPVAAYASVCIEFSLADDDEGDPPDVAEPSPR
jgi:hypothetical protein